VNREPRTLDTGLKKDTSSKLTRHHPNSNPPKSTQLTTQLSSTQLNSTRNPAHPVCLAGQSSAQHSAALAQPIAKQKGQPSADVSSNHFHLHQPQYVRGGSSNKEHDLREKKNSRREEGEREEERERMGFGVGGGREGAVGLSPEAEDRSRRRTLAVSFDPPPAVSCARKRCDLQVKRARELAGWEGWLKADQPAATASATRQRCVSSQAARLEIDFPANSRAG